MYKLYAKYLFLPHSQGHSGTPKTFVKYFKYSAKCYHIPFLKIHSPASKTSLVTVC